MARMMDYDYKAFLSFFVHIYHTSFSLLISSWLFFFSVSARLLFACHFILHTGQHFLLEYK